MVKTEVELPDPLFAEISRVAREHDWTLADALCRGAEVLVKSYASPRGGAAPGWKTPAPLEVDLLVEDARRAETGEPPELTGS